MTERERLENKAFFVAEDLAFVFEKNPNYVMVIYNLNNTKKYEYQDKFFYSSKTQKNRALIEGLERKEEELSSLEDENRTISEALKDQQETGKDIGEE